MGVGNRITNKQRIERNKKREEEAKARYEKGKKWGEEERAKRKIHKQGILRAKGSGTSYGQDATVTKTDTGDFISKFKDGKLIRKADQETGKISTFDKWDKFGNVIGKGTPEPVVKPTGFESIREEIGPEEEVEGEVGGVGLTEEEQALADKKQAEIDAWEEKGFVGKMFEPPPKLGDQLGFPLPIGPPGLKALQEGGKAAARFGGFRKVNGRLEVLKVLDEGAVSIDDLVYGSDKTNKGMAQVVERKGNEIINFGKSRGLDGGFLGREIKNINKKGQNELWKYINKLGKSLGVGAALGTGGFLAVGGPTLLTWFAADNIGTMNNMEADKVEERYMFGEGRFTKEETLEDLDDLIASQKEAARTIRDTRSKAPILNFFGIGKSFQGNSDDILIKLEELRNDIKIGKIIAIERR